LPVFSVQDFMLKIINLLPTINDYSELTYSPISSRTRY
jgi:hypothetical protein